MGQSKQNLRTLLRERRNTFVKSHNQDDFIHKIIDHLIYLNFKPCSVAAYWPMGSEMDTRPLLDWFNIHGFSLGLPFTKNRDHVLEFYRWTPETELETGLFNTKVCKARKEKITPRIVIIPLLGFDPTGSRLGQGGGYYDTTLNYLRAQHSLTAIGLAFDCQLVNDIPREDHDQRLDYVLTPSTLWKFRPGKD
jgi:5-formyltetrahydrofolate cyclo-ligase